MLVLPFGSRETPALAVMSTKDKIWKNSLSYPGTAPVDLASPSFALPQCHTVMVENRRLGVEKVDDDDEGLRRPVNQKWGNTKEENRKGGEEVKEQGKT